MRSPPWLHSFRAKLIFTFFPLLAAITAACLWLAEKNYSEVQRQLVEHHFDSYLDTFNEARKQRFDTIEGTLQDLAESPILHAAIQNGLLDKLRQELETRLRPFALPARTITDPQRPAPPNLRPPGTARNPQNPPAAGSLQRPPPPPAAYFYFDILDAEGKPLNLSPTTLTRPNRPNRTSSFFHSNGKRVIASLDQPQIAYKLIYPPNDPDPKVMEIFMTPIRLSPTSPTVGALIFGLPMQTLRERQLYRQTNDSAFGQIMSGIWLEDTLVSDTIPETHQQEIAANLQRALANPNEDDGESIVTINGTRHRLIYHQLNADTPFFPAAQINLYSLAAADLAIRELRVIALEIGLLAMLISLAAIWFLSRNLSRPITALTDATHQIAEGHFEHRIPVTQKGELGTLSQAFNLMAADLQRKDRYRSLLHSVADPAIAERLISQPTSLQGEQKIVSMLFCDVRGFTALSEQLPPAQVVAMINEHMTALTRVAYQFQGTVDKFVGDMIMVLFGAPESTPDHAQLAVECARAMQTARKEMNQQNTTSPALEIGIGIATGLVTAGCMGSEQRLSYTVLGHNVNLASRLCQLAGAGQIIIDHQTRSQLTDPSPFPIQPMPAQPLKGISEIIPLYQIK